MINIHLLTSIIRHDTHSIYCIHIQVSIYYHYALKHPLNTPPSTSQHPLLPLHTYLYTPLYTPYTYPPILNTPHTGYDIPLYVAKPSTEKEQVIHSRYAKVLG